jgi:hypothetical protein
VFYFHAEPMREAYRGLLRFALMQSAAFSLVTRRDLKAGDSHNRCLDELRPFLLDERVVDGVATLRRYRADPGAIETLFGAVRGLYGWVQPKHPEDLAFYDSEGRCWLETVAHEHMGFVNETIVDVNSLVRMAPGLDLRPYQDRVRNR